MSEIIKTLVALVGVASTVIGVSRSIRPRHLERGISLLKARDTLYDGRNDAEAKSLYIELTELAEYYIRREVRGLDMGPTPEVIHNCILLNLGMAAGFASHDFACAYLFSWDIATDPALMWLGAVFAVALAVGAILITCWRGERLLRADYLKDGMGAFNTEAIDKRQGLAMTSPVVFLLAFVFGYFAVDNLLSWGAVAASVAMVVEFVITFVHGIKRDCSSKS